MSESNDSIVPITLWVGGESLVGYAIIYVFQNRGLVFSCKTIAVLDDDKVKEYTGIEDNEKVSDLSKYLGGYIQYVIHQKAFSDLNLDELYYDGDSGMKGLANYKNIYFKHILYYNKLLTQDYIKKLEGE